MIRHSYPRRSSLAERILSLGTAQSAHAERGHMGSWLPPLGFSLINEKMRFPVRREPEETGKHAPLTGLIITLPIKKETLNRPPFMFPLFSPLNRTFTACHTCESNYVAQSGFTQERETTDVSQFWESNSQTEGFVRQTCIPLRSPPVCSDIHVMRRRRRRRRSLCLGDSTWSRGPNSSGGFVLGQLQDPAKTHKSPYP